MKPVILNFTSRLSPTLFTRTRQSDAHPCKQDSRYAIPSITDLNSLRAQRVLCIVDGDNWDISAKNRGLQVRYDRLLLTLQKLAHRVFPVAVITSNPGDNRSANALIRSGWRVVSIQREVFSTPNGLQKIANADSDLCFELGVLSSVADLTAAIIGTGDGNLAISCAAGLKRTYRKPPINVHTLSFAGTTSGRLRSRPDLFRSAVLLGSDVLAPVVAGLSNTFVTKKGSSHAY